MLDKVHRKPPNFVLTVICCVIVIFLMGCGPESEIEITEDQNSQNVVEATTNENTEDDDAVFHIDLTKISPMIQENVSENVVVAATMLVLGLGGATLGIAFGNLSISISGMSLAAVIGVILNLCLPEEKNE